MIDSKLGAILCMVLMSVTFLLMIYFLNKCKHRYNNLTKQYTRWYEMEEIVKEDENGKYKAQQPVMKSETIEILVCEKCGHIKKLVY